MAKKKAKKAAKKVSKGCNPQLIKLCVDILAHMELDMEIDIGGNGTNCAEATNVAREVLSILGTDENKLAGEICARVSELEEEYGMGEDDDDDCDDDCDCDDDDE